MKRIFIVSVFVVFGAVAVFGQAQPAGRVGLINVFALGDKGGATRYVNALNAVNKKFESEITGLRTLAGTIQAKTAELQSLAQQAQQKNSPISSETLRLKNDELEKMKRDAKFKQEDLQARINSERQKVVGPVWSSMRLALRDFAKKNGYSVILDGAKLEEGGLLMAFDEKYDVTKQFIAFYNARPATSASVKQ